MYINYEYTKTDKNHENCNVLEEGLYTYQSYTVSFSKCSYD